MSITNIARKFQNKFYAEKKSEPMPIFRPGDTIAVKIKIIEGESERISTLKGICVSRRKGLSPSCTIRKISSGIGVEKTVPFNSPLFVSLEVLKRGKVRRSVLNYLRHIKGSIKIKERFSPKISK